MQHCMPKGAHQLLKRIAPVAGHVDHEQKLALRHIVMSETRCQHIPAGAKQLHFKSSPGCSAAVPVESAYQLASPILWPPPIMYAVITEAGACQGHGWWLRASRQLHCQPCGHNVQTMDVGSNACKHNLQALSTGCHKQHGCLQPCRLWGTNTTSKPSNPACMPMP
jgi:hypothetical protein